MSNAMKKLMRLHPASHYSRRERPSASMGADGMDSMRLERAAYRLVVNIDRLVGAIAALGWRVVLFLAGPGVTAERRSARADKTRA